MTLSLITMFGSLLSLKSDILFSDNCLIGLSSSLSSTCPPSLHSPIKKASKNISLVSPPIPTPSSLVKLASSNKSELPLCAFWYITKHSSSIYSIFHFSFLWTFLISMYCKGILRIYVVVSIAVYITA